MQTTTWTGWEKKARIRFSFEKFTFFVKELFSRMFLIFDTLRLRSRRGFSTTTTTTATTTTAVWRSLSCLQIEQRLSFLQIYLFRDKRLIESNLLPPKNEILLNFDFFGFSIFLGGHWCSSQIFLSSFSRGKLIRVFSSRQGIGFTYNVFWIKSQH